MFQSNPVIQISFFGQEILQQKKKRLHNGVCNTSAEEDWGHKMRLKKIKRFICQVFNLRIMLKFENRVDLKKKCE